MFLSIYLCVCLFFYLFCKQVFQADLLKTVIIHSYKYFAILCRNSKCCLSNVKSYFPFLEITSLAFGDFNRRMHFLTGETKISEFKQNGLLSLLTV